MALGGRRLSVWLEKRNGVRPGRRSLGPASRWLSLGSRCFFGALGRVGPNGLLLHLPRRVDVDSAPTARLLAQTAARAPALDYARHTEEVADLLTADV